jgi:hypothetical protein
VLLDGLGIEENAVRSPLTARTRVQPFPFLWFLEDAVERKIILTARYGQNRRTQQVGSTENVSHFIPDLPSLNFGWPTDWPEMGCSASDPNIGKYSQGKGF